MKYLDYEGLQAYDNSIKNYIDNNVPDLAQAANLATALKNAADPTSSVKIALCTQAEYGALESYQENVIYIITDDTSGVVYTYANETLDGTESVLTSITIQGIKYAIPQGTEVTANPTLDGNETALTGLQIGNTKYAVGGGSSSTTKYNHCLLFNAKTGSNYGAYMSINFEKDNNTPITLKAFLDLLYNNSNIQIAVVGSTKDSSNFMVIKSISYNASSSYFYIWVVKDSGSLDAIALNITRNSDGTYTGTDLQLIDQTLEITL